MPNDTNQPIPTADMVNEQLLIQQLGITEKKIRALRPAAACVQRGPGGHAWWPAVDAVALASHMGFSLTLPDKDAADDDVETLTVVRRYTNPHLIGARRATGEVVDVRVVDNKKYLPRLRIGGGPMTFKGRPAPTGHWWVLAQKEPRHLAQW